MANKEVKAARMAAQKAAEEKAAQKAARKKIIIWASIILVVLAIAAVIAVPKLKQAAAMKHGVFADIVIKDYGTVTFRLETGKAPITCKNFIELAESGFYNGLTFHRIIDGFMIQGGDPNGNGTGGSGKNIIGEFKANGRDTGLSHTRGAVSMARSSAYDSASSQFFIVHQDFPSLDGQYAVFGYVTAGMDVVDAICAAARPVDNNGTIPSEEQPVIESVTIRHE